ncbi:MAG: ATP-binding protein [Leptolyngbyaceae cyanobacterium MO_188.B28]|nr:ATP-binding protein [Leptolyngbyaceae cyanobacterium MO_188.B28]
MDPIRSSICPNPSADDIFFYNTTQSTSTLILIAAQDKTLRGLLRRKMEGEGYQVVEATTGEQCLDAYLKNCPDLVLLDACVSGIDSFTCCNKLSVLSESHPAPILMMLSLMSDPKAVNQALAAGAADCMMKPINPALWLHRIRHWLQQSQLTQQLRQLNRDLANQVGQRTAQFEAQTTQLSSNIQFQEMLQRLPETVSDARDVSQLLRSLVDEFALVWTHIAELEILNRHKDDFLSTVSHELRNPIYNMRLIAEILGQSLRKGMKERGKVLPLNSDFMTCASYLKILQDECEQLAVLIDDLLELQRIEAEKQPIDLAPIPLQSWIPEVMAPFQVRAQERRLSLTVKMDPDLPSIVSQPSRLKRVLAELLNNACKYTPPGEVVRLNVAIKGGCFQLSVSNSGIAIPHEKLPCIFDKFYRIPSSDVWHQGGVGLGLALVKRLVHALGGSIQVESSVEQTCFTVELPRLDESIT